MSLLVDLVPVIAPHILGLVDAECLPHSMHLLLVEGKQFLVGCHELIDQLDGYRFHGC